MTEQPTIALHSVQSLFLEMRVNGQPLATGTGFIMQKQNSSYLITNRHNVTGRHQESGKPLSSTLGVPNEIVIVHNVKNALGHWTTKTEMLFENDEPRWFEHPTLGSKADFVALPITEHGDIDLYPYDLTVSNETMKSGPAEILSVIGFPFGLTAGGALGIWATGFVASEPELDFRELPVFLIDCRSKPGQSGSPVISYKDGGVFANVGGGTSVHAGAVFRLLGIYSGRIHPESDIGMVWKTSAIVELLDSI